MCGDEPVGIAATDLVRGRVEHLDRVDARDREVQRFPVVAEFQIARRILERHATYYRARLEVDDQ
jgi:hypothetical protein